MESTESESSENLAYYFTIATSVTTELKIKNSRFIAFAFPVKNQEDCQSILSKYQKRFHNASHICFAYRLGIGDQQQYRYSDAGEPSGTAGAPIFNVIEGANITNILILVVRYFGGIKLGVGGLIRAYTDAAQEALKAAAIVKKELREIIRFTITYQYLSKILHEIPVASAQIIHQNYSDNIEFVVSVPMSGSLKFKELLTNISSGTIKFLNLVHNARS